MDVHRVLSQWDERAVHQALLAQSNVDPQRLLWNLAAGTDDRRDAARVTLMQQLGLDVEPAYNHAIAWAVSRAANGEIEHTGDVSIVAIVERAMQGDVAARRIVAAIHEALYPSSGAGS